MGAHVHTHRCTPLYPLAGSVLAKMMKTPASLALEIQHLSPLITHDLEDASHSALQSAAPARGTTRPTIRNKKKPNFSATPPATMPAQKHRTPALALDGVSKRGALGCTRQTKRLGCTTKHTLTSSSAQTRRIRCLAQTDRSCVGGNKQSVRGLKQHAWLEEQSNQMPELTC